MQIIHHGFIAAFVATIVVSLAPVAARAQAAGPFDGKYVGSTTNITSGKGTQGCQGNPNKTITVKGSVLEFTNTSTSTKELFHDMFPVAADGKFKGTAGNAGEIAGQFSASGMTGEWSVGKCLLKLDFKKS